MAAIFYAPTCDSAAGGHQLTGRRRPLQIGRGCRRQLADILHRSRARPPGLRADQGDGGTAHRTLVHADRRRAAFRDQVRVAVNVRGVSRTIEGRRSNRMEISTSPLRDAPAPADRGRGAMHASRRSETGRPRSPTTRGRPSMWCWRTWSPARSRPPAHGRTCSSGGASWWMMIVGALESVTDFRAITYGFWLDHFPSICPSFPTGCQRTDNDVDGRIGIVDHWHQRHRSATDSPESLQSSCRLLSEVRVA